MFAMTPLFGICNSEVQIKGFTIRPVKADCKSALSVFVMHCAPSRMAVKKSEETSRVSKTFEVSLHAISLRHK